MSTLGLKKPSQRQKTASPRPSYKANVNASATLRHLGGAGAGTRLRQMQEDMDKIAGTKR
jgi:hypothetical protein